MQRAESLKLDIQLYNRIILLQVGRRFDSKEMSDLRQNQAIHPQLKMMQWSYDKLLLLTPKVTRSHLEDALSLFVRKITRIYKTAVQVGVGNVHAMSELNLSYEEALMALTASAAQRQVSFHEDLKLELLLANMPPQVAEDFLQRTIGPIMHDDELLENLATWLESNESLNDIACTLHIHKNTLKYRLKKIEKLLGVSLNERVHQVELMLAIQLYRNYVH